MRATRHSVTRCRRRPRWHSAASSRSTFGLRMPPAAAPSSPAPSSSPPVRRSTERRSATRHRVPRPATGSWQAGPARSCASGSVSRSAPATRSRACRPRRRSRSPPSRPQTTRKSQPGSTAGRDPSLVTGRGQAHIQLAEEGQAMERNLGRATGIIRRILDALLLALIVVVLSGVVLGKLVPLTGRQTIVIGGGSMEPAVPLRSAVIIRSVDAGELAAGDIVSLKAGPQNTLYTHRIVAVIDRPDGRWVQTKGDANADQDPNPVHASAIVGRTEIVIPLAGYLIALLSIPAGVVFLVGLAASLLAGARLLESL